MNYQALNTNLPVSHTGFLVLEARGFSGAWSSVPGAF